jgi:hypothetical protein
MTLTIGALWRYPAKTLACERLDANEIVDGWCRTPLAMMLLT